MTEAETAEEPCPGKPVRGQGNGVLLTGAFLASVLINGLIILVLLLIVLPSTRPNSPSIEVAFQKEEKEPDDLDQLTIDKLKRRVDPGQSSAGMARPVVAPASLVSINVPEFTTSTSGSIPGLDIGIAPGIGKGNGLSGTGTGGGVRTGSIGGMKVKAARLGVVLDVSGSMDEHIRRVRRELKREFKLATVVEVTGCSLDWIGKIAFDLKQSQRTVKLKSRADTVLDGMEMLIAAERVDAVFWFSDLQDQQTNEGLLRLSSLLGTTEGSGRKPVRFYVRSVQNEPSDQLMAIIERSGGGAQ